jgi:hypothetical protein
MVSVTFVIVWDKVSVTLQPVSVKIAESEAFRAFHLQFVSRQGLAVRVIFCRFHLQFVYFSSLPLAVRVIFATRARIEMSQMNTNCKWKRQKLHELQVKIRHELQG